MSSWNNAVQTKWVTDILCRIYEINSLNIEQDVSSNGQKCQKKASLWTIRKGYQRAEVIKQIIGEK